MTIRIQMKDEHASAVADALSYYLTSAQNNFGSGWERGDPDNGRREYDCVRQVFDRLNKKVEALS